MLAQENRNRATGAWEKYWSQYREQSSLLPSIPLFLFDLIIRYCHLTEFYNRDNPKSAYYDNNLFLSRSADSSQLTVAEKIDNLAAYFFIPTVRLSRFIRESWPLSSHRNALLRNIVGLIKLAIAIIPYLLSMMLATALSGTLGTVRDILRAVIDWVCIVLAIKIRHHPLRHLLTLAGFAGALSVVLKIFGVSSHVVTATASALTGAIAQLGVWCHAAFGWMQVPAFSAVMTPAVTWVLLSIVAIVIMAQVGKWLGSAFDKAVFYCYNVRSEQANTAYIEDAIGFGRGRLVRQRGGFLERIEMVEPPQIEADSDSENVTRRRSPFSREATQVEQSVSQPGSGRFDDEDAKHGSPPESPVSSSPRFFAANTEGVPRAVSANDELDSDHVSTTPRGSK